jgi:hypothetical protein
MASSVVNATDKDHQDIVKRLDALINVIFETGGKNGTAVQMVTRIRILHQAGMRPVEISKILGKKVAYINKELSRMRKVGGE